MAKAKSKGRNRPGARRNAPRSQRKSPAIAAKLKGPEKYELPAVLDTSAAATILKEFKARRGRSIEIDAGQVQRVGALALQVLVSAELTWAKDGMAIALTNPTKELMSALELVGLRNKLTLVRAAST